MKKKEKYTNNVNDKKVKKKKKWTGPLIILLIFLLLFGGAWAVFSNYYNLSNYLRDKDVEVTKTFDLEDAGLTDEEKEEMIIAAQEADDIEIQKQSDVYNLLLVGVDRRNKSWNGNSDTMILMSINYKTKRMHMISFMRDMYANIEGYGVCKLNAACAVGGGPFLIKTIEENYKVHIDNYASVDFPGLAKIIDYAGGIELTLSDAEVNSANGMIQMMCEAENEDPSPHLLSGPGTYNCDGWQAVAYARIRSVGNSDWQRTERQRTVMSQLMGKIKQMSFTDLNSYVRKVLPLVTHNVESTEMLKLVTKVPIVLTGYEMGKSRVPYDGMYSIKNEILFPNMKETILKLQATIDAEELCEWEE